MSFRLWTIFYVFALVAAAMSTFGPLGIVVAGIILGFWARMFYASNSRMAFFELLIWILIIGALVALLLPAVQSARERSPRMHCMNNLKQIALAMENYEAVHGTLPPAFVADANGKPMHSWRVLLLPFLEEDSLFKEYDFNEPWNGPINSKLAGLMPDVYRCPSNFDDLSGKSFETDYFVAADPKTAFPDSGLPLKKVIDGTSKTIMVIEASGLHRNWLDPRALSLEETVELMTAKPRSGHRRISDGFLTTTYYETSDRNVAFCDSHMEHMGQLTNAEIARALLTVAGGESIPQVLEEFDVESRAMTVIKWGKVWTLSLFVVLALLPAARMRRSAANSAGDSRHRG
jgi:type II secretory pathway pseudopilin PulG